MRKVDIFMVVEKIELINQELNNLDYKEMECIYKNLQKLYKKIQTKYGIEIKKCFTGCSDIFFNRT
ncbi:hypothetical protein [Thermobrachium celere]|uniref:hypothetical protein n=1 Tax=Thermobrachium celere TaxID=53422 RepID=UPI001A415B9F|nr:hypothetical protein [Thermobrachium celere]GFR36424.1 hypothetical protein TCEA9_22360 [Thermobrachium celere]